MYTYIFTNQINLYIFLFTFFIYICSMDFKEYLLTQKEFTLNALAVRMWPANKTAYTYLSKKLHEQDGRKFGPKDERLARAALKELGIHLIEKSKEK